MQNYFCAEEEVGPTPALRGIFFWFRDWDQIFWADRAHGKLSIGTTLVPIAKFLGRRQLNTPVLSIFGPPLAWNFSLEDHFRYRKRIAKKGKKGQFDGPPSFYNYL